jgi:5-(carboxyamino)imidazole ribonucleotide synthase
VSFAPLLPGERRARDGAPTTLGVLGGGQLGRMFAQAGQAMGYRVVVLDPDPEGPAAQVADLHIRGGYTDEVALQALARACDAVTTEFENVPAQALRRLAEQVRVAPSADAVAVCQHRAREKAHFAACGVPCAPHVRIESAADWQQLPEALFPAILKTATLGYDGKGQQAVPTWQHLPQAWEALGRVPCLLEQRVPLALEFSVIVARDSGGHCVHLPLQQNVHRDGILAVTQVPAPGVPEPAAREALAHTERLAAALGYVGVLCVEWFLLTDGRVLANEMAPRPHNSGHASLDACDLSQFALQVRTLAGLPLPAPRLQASAVMLNLLGDLWFAQSRRGAGALAPAAADSGTHPHAPDWPAVLALPGVHLHLYGKAEPRPGRKMGHLTVTAADGTQALATAREAAARLGLPPP